jgi:osmotically inducible protein OsmC
LSVRVSRHAEASWQGTVPEGGGRIALGSGAYEGAFTLRNRIEDVERGTNPEELIAAAEAGCFTMSLADLLSEAGTPPADLQTTVRVRLEQKDEGFRITRISVSTVGDVPGVDAEQFAALAEAGTEITLEVSLK